MENAFNTRYNFAIIKGKYSNEPDMKTLLTLDLERYTSSFDIGGKLGQCCM